MITPALRVQGLTKLYRTGVHALKGVDFAVAPGDCFALLGPNGAGKSTIIGIITSLVQKTAGDVQIFGHDIDQDFATAKSYLGVVPQEFNFNGFEKVEQIVVNQAGYYGIPRDLATERAEKYLRRLGLWDKRKTSARFLSGGMKRRLMIVRALLHEPKMLVLDEPTAGVDIEIRRDMWKFLRELNQEGTTIILTTHYLEEAEHLCRNLAIIDQGNIVKQGTMISLLNELEREWFILYLDQACPSSELPVLKDYPMTLGCTTEGSVSSIEVEVPKRLGLNPLFAALAAKNIRVNSMRNKTNRLEALFLRLTSAGES